MPRKPENADMIRERMQLLRNQARGKNSLVARADPVTKKMLKNLFPEAVRRLGELLGSENEGVAIRAAEIVIERNLGKVAQPLEISGPDGGPISVQAAQVVLARLDPASLRALQAMATQPALPPGESEVIDGEIKEVQKLEPGDSGPADDSSESSGDIGDDAGEPVPGEDA